MQLEWVGACAGNLGQLVRIVGMISVSGREGGQQAYKSIKNGRFDQRILSNEQCPTVDELRESTGTMETNPGQCNTGERWRW